MWKQDNDQFNGIQYEWCNRTHKRFDQIDYHFDCDLNVLDGNVRIYKYTYIQRVKTKSGFVWLLRNKNDKTNIRHQ
mgnify:CR=1 FL=1